MNLYFNFWIIHFLLLVLLIQPIHGREVILINFDQDSSEPKAHKIHQIITEKLSIPKELVKTQKTKDPCVEQSLVFLQICITNKGQVYYPVIKRAELKRTFAVFLEERNEN
ncbi:MAG: hypothetical protein HN509_14650 [Halobacteriovoraceae bacterium]|jgi:hypothetical protein|nr:hypothetical protein [Halobacteriovoraceae bacterium]